MITKIRQNIGSLFVLFMLISFLIFKIKDCNKVKGFELSKIICDSIYQTEISGVVYKIYNDKNHDVLKYDIISSGKKKVLSNTYLYKIDNLRNVLAEGDSIYKPSNSFKNYIFKGKDKNKIIIVQAYSCCCGDSIPEYCDSLIKKWKEE